MSPSRLKTKHYVNKIFFSHRMRMPMLAQHNFIGMSYSCAKSSYRPGRLAGNTVHLEDDGKPVIEAAHAVTTPYLIV